MDMKATESIHSGCCKASCVNVYRTDCFPFLLKAHERVQRGLNCVNSITSHRFAVCCVALEKGTFYPPFQMSFHEKREEYTDITAND